MWAREFNLIIRVWIKLYLNSLKWNYFNMKIKKIREQQAYVKATNRHYFHRLHLPHDKIFFCFSVLPMLNVKFLQLMWIDLRFYICGFSWIKEAVILNFQSCVMFFYYYYSSTVLWLLCFCRNSNFHFI